MALNGGREPVNQLRANKLASLDLDGNDVNITVMAWVRLRVRVNDTNTILPYM